MQLPKSILGSFCGRSTIREGDVLIALKAYLDSSGKLENEWITLAALASTDEVWAKLEMEWDKILQGSNPPVPYIHMKEAYRLEKAFDKNLGWDRDKAFQLIGKCLVLMSHLPKDTFRVFYCSVHLTAWHKLRAETYQMPDPVEMCNKYCSEFILKWYGFVYKPKTTIVDPRSDSVRYFFDKNEYFFQPFYDKWKLETNTSDATGRWSIWNAIDEVAPVEMRKTPGIQAADIIAWCRNRETFTQDGDVAHLLSHILRRVTPTSYVIWDEAKLRQQYKPLIHIP